ncbi:hypothetical protein ACFSX5_07605 [Devosia albogilva]|uniref:Uncharacterized protein n=1 Tax=Devosia albogilva TaxID=429726 RepID=A0ABW5QJC1_9HYPH
MKLSEYIREHRLVAKYVGAIVIAVLVGVGSWLQGDPPSVATLKAMLSIVFVIAWLGLGALFNPERSQIPFSPSRMERTLLEGILVALAVGVVSWTPDDHPAVIAIAAVTASVVYFAARMLLDRFRANRSR